MNGTLSRARAALRTTCTNPSISMPLGRCPCVLRPLRFTGRQVAACHQNRHMCTRDGVLQLYYSNELGCSYLFRCLSSMGFVPSSTFSAENNTYARERAGAAMVLRRTFSISQRCASPEPSPAFSWSVLSEPLHVYISASACIPCSPRMHANNRKRGGMQPSRLRMQSTIAWTSSYYIYRVFLSVLLSHCPTHLFPSRSPCLGTLQLRKRGVFL